MHIERLNHLKTILKNVQPEQLAMSNWFFQLDHGKPACGTAACAAGHACLDPVFQEQGLGYFKGEPSYVTNDATYRSWEVLDKFFDLSSYQTIELFCAESYTVNVITPAHVIAKIDELIENAT